MHRNRPESSPSSSPATKRQKLSSPSNDRQMSSQSIPGSSQSPIQQTDGDRLRNIKDALRPPPPKINRSLFTPRNENDVFTGPCDGPDDPFKSVTPAFTTASALASTSRRNSVNNSQSCIPLLPTPTPASPNTNMGFQSAVSLQKAPQKQSRTPSPEVQEKDNRPEWFDPPPPSLPDLDINNLTAFVGFVKASNKTQLLPSTSSISKAQEKIKEWVQDVEIILPTPSQVSPTSMSTDVTLVVSTPSSSRSVLRPVENSYMSSQPFESPTPSGSSLKKKTRLGNLGTTKALTGGITNKQFKPPLKAPPQPKPFYPPAHSSPLNPSQSIASADFSVPLPKPEFPPVASATPVRPTGRPLLQKSPIKHKFVTPFKHGMALGEPGRAALEKKNATSLKYLPPPAVLPNRSGQNEIPSPVSGSKKNQGSPSRKTLASSGLVPQSYEVEELEEMGINVADLQQITIETALHYTFHTPSSNSIEDMMPIDFLGPSAALHELLEKGCSLATKAWVENHWCLILWKLAGMVALDPQNENNPKTRRWCWAEVMCQLLYRYKRELDGGSRPALRLIATRDAPPSSPMVLCVSGIKWTSPGISATGASLEPFPELEVTDGWYRLKARVDESLARAIGKGTIRVGRKIAIAGAWLKSERKEPQEVLESYTSTKLVISGNSSHLAPWHMKLGFHSGPYISTLHSLDPDGGVIAVLDVTVHKTHPLGFLETIIRPDGGKENKNPHTAEEEEKRSREWQRQWGKEEERLWSELNQKLHKLEGYAERLEHRAGSRFCPREDDSPPDGVDSLYAELEDASPDEIKRIFSRLSINESGWLARHIHEAVQQERESGRDEIARELEDICPRRVVRDLRVIVLKDTHTNRRPGLRLATTTVWGVLGLTFTEGGQAGAFEIGQRFLVTNLTPTSKTSWMDRNIPDAEIHLVTRKDSRWTKLS